MVIPVHLKNHNIIENVEKQGNKKTDKKEEVLHRCLHNEIINDSAKSRQTLGLNFLHGNKKLPLRFHMNKALKFPVNRSRRF